MILTNKDIELLNSKINDIKRDKEDSLFIDGMSSIIKDYDEYLSEKIELLELTLINNNIKIDDSFKGCIMTIISKEHLIEEDLFIKYRCMLVKGIDYEDKFFGLATDIVITYFLVDIDTGNVVSKKAYNKNDIDKLFDGYYISKIEKHS